MPKIQGEGNCQQCQIRQSSIFADLSESQLDGISTFRTSITTFKAGEIIYIQDDPSLNAYTLRKGLVKLSKSLPDGRIQIIRILKHGDLFGFDGFADQNYNHTATALSDCEVCRLPLTKLQELRTNIPEIDKAMMHRWIENLRTAENMMLELGAKKAPERLASFLLDWCDAHNPLEHNDSWIDLHLSRSEIGELLGLTLETVSRFLSKWKKSGLIKESKGMIQIVDPQGLMEISKA